MTDKIITTVDLPHKIELQTPQSYVWIATFDEAAFEVSKQIVPGHQVGEASMDVFSVKPLREGNYDIHFELKRPWETAAQDTKVYSFEIQPA